MTDYLTKRPESVGEAWGRIIQMNGEIERQESAFLNVSKGYFKLEDEIERLKAELAKHQESEFHPDWSMLEATRGLLREHKAELKAARDEIENWQDDRKYQEPYLRSELEKAWKLKVELRDENRMLAESNRALREQIAALESKEVCNCPHDDWVIEGCPYCRIEAYEREWRPRLHGVCLQPSNRDHVFARAQEALAAIPAQEKP